MYDVRSVSSVYRLIAYPLTILPDLEKESLQSRRTLGKTVHLVSHRRAALSELVIVF